MFCIATPPLLNLWCIIIVVFAIESLKLSLEPSLEPSVIQVKRKEETYNKGKYALDQKVAAGKRGLEDEERRLESLRSAEDLDRLTVEHNASVDLLRVQNEVRFRPDPHENS